MSRNKSKCIAYTRVSSVEQVDGYSLTFQENDIKQFALKNDLEIVKIFVEKGKSAKTINRVELQNLLTYCKKNSKSIDFLIIWDFQRLARNVFDHLSIEKQLEDMDISILSVKEFNTDTPQARLYRTVMGAVNQFDNEERGLKSKSGMEQAILEGRWIYGVPFGYTYKESLKGKKIITPNDKQYIVKELFQVAASGLYSSSSLVKMFENKIPNLSLKYLKRILSNELYIGYINTEKTPKRIKGIHEAIISDSLFWEAQKIYKSKKKAHFVYNDFPLNGFAKHQGAPLSGCWARGKTKKYRHYRTHKIKFNISAEKAEALFINLLKEISIKQEIIDILLHSINDYFDYKNANKSDRISHLNNELQQNTKKSKNIDSLLIDGCIDKKIYLEHKSDKK